MIKLLLELHLELFNKSLKQKQFNLNDIIQVDEELLFVRKKELLLFNSEFCEMINSKGDMQAKTLGQQGGHGAFVFLLWEDGSKDWIQNTMLCFFKKIENRL